MIIGCLAENNPNEKRVLISPDTAKKITSFGINILIPKNYGYHSSFLDESYLASGVKITEASEITLKSDLIFKITEDGLDQFNFKEGSYIILSNCDKNKLKNNKLKIFGLNYLPRITRAQSMDVLSSQANLAGYKAVIDSAYEFNKALPMMMTAAGTITPAKYFIVGAGVAGLQAIATAKRLGAIVSATDVRAASKEQVESLGGKFVFVESNENLETSGGYAKEVSEEYKKKQEELIKKTIVNQDVVICTALIPGKKAPRIITEEMVLSMKPGSVICDLAASQGGNCAFSESDKIIEKNGVKIIGYSNYPSRIAGSSSSLLAKNILNFLELIFDKKNKVLKIDLNDEIIKGVLVN